MPTVLSGLGATSARIYLGITCSMPRGDFNTAPDLCESVTHRIGQRSPPTLELWSVLSAAARFLSSNSMALVFFVGVAGGGRAGIPTGSPSAAIPGLLHAWRSPLTEP